MSDKVGHIGNIFRTLREKMLVDPEDREMPFEKEHAVLMLTNTNFKVAVGQFHNMKCIVNICATYDEREKPS
jgi:hypothetical protein